MGELPQFEDDEPHQETAPEVKEEPPKEEEPKKEEEVPKKEEEAPKKEEEAPKKEEEPAKKEEEPPKKEEEPPKKEEEPPKKEEEAPKKEEEPAKKEEEPAKKEEEAPKKEEEPPKKEEEAAKKEDEEEKKPPPTNKAGKPKLPIPTPTTPTPPTPSSASSAAPSPSPASEDKPASKPGKVNAMAIGLKIPMPGMAPKKEKEKEKEKEEEASPSQGEGGVSFDKPVEVKPLAVATKRRTQPPNRAQKAPTRPTRFYLWDGSYKGLPLKQEASVLDAKLLLAEKMDIPEKKLKKWALYDIKIDGTETELSEKSALSDITTAWGDERLSHKLFFKKKDYPLIIVINPEFFESSAFPSAENPQGDGEGEEGLSASASQGLTKSGSQLLVAPSPSQSGLTPSPSQQLPKSGSQQQLPKSGSQPQLSKSVSQHSTLKEQEEEQQEVSAEEKERIEKERIEKERIEKERIEREKIEKERIEKERIEREKIEKERKAVRDKWQEKQKKKREKREREDRERRERERKEEEEEERKRKEKEKERQEKGEEEAPRPEVKKKPAGMGMGGMPMGDLSAVKLKKADPAHPHPQPKGGDPSSSEPKRSEDHKPSSPHDGASSPSSPVPASPSSPSSPQEKKPTSYLRKAECVLTVSDSSVSCTVADKPAKPFPLGAKELVGVKMEERTVEGQQLFSLHVYYWNSARKGKTEVAKETIDFSDSSAAEGARAKIAALLTHKFTVKNALVVVNPVAGKKKGEYILQKYVAPLLEAAAVKATVKVTSAKGDALKIIQEADFSSLDAIICISGDGTIHEVLNGIMKRKDWKEASNVPVGAIAAGNSNTLPLSLRGEEKAFDAALATFDFLQGKSMKQDVLLVKKGDEVSFGFSGVFFGYLEEAPLRFVTSLNDKFKGMMAKPKYHDVACKLAISVVEEDKSRLKGAPLAGQDKDGKGKGRAREQDLSPLLPPLDQPIPEGWKVLEGMAGLSGGKLPYSHRGYAVAPFASPSDALIDLCVVAPGALKQLPKIVKSAEKGQHIGFTEVQYFKSNGFRLEPAANSGNVYVDGESYGTVPIQVEVQPQLFTVFHTKETYSLS